jgi:uncharacterized protein YgiB involved in biofilm formation
MAISLVLLGSTAVGLSACKPKTENYSNIEACKASGKHTEQECREGFAQALSEHHASAPQFSSREECSAASGPAGCEERNLPTGATVFLPMMLGFVLEPGIGYRPLYQYPGRRDCLFTRDGGRYGDCSSGGSGGAHGGWFHGGGSSGGDDGTSARGGFGEAGHAASGGHGGGGE